MPYSFHANDIFIYKNALKNGLKYRHLIGVVSDILPAASNREYETFRILIRIGHLKCSFYLPGTQLVAMATLQLRGVRGAQCLFSENVKNSQFQRDIVILYKHRFEFGIST